MLESQQEQNRLNKKIEQINSELLAAQTKLSAFEGVEEKEKGIAKTEI
jgi:hypothetical protein